MKNKFNQLFKSVSEVEPSVDLIGFIFARIEKEKIRKSKRQLFFSYIGLSSSVLLTVFSWIFFGQTFLQSEFWTIFSLIFSDIVIVLKNLDTFFLSLLETFPFVHAAIFLVPVFLLLFFADYYLSNKANRKYKFNLLTH
jgi:hypothetical protein